MKSKFNRWHRSNLAFVALVASLFFGCAKQNSTLDETGSRRTGANTVSTSPTAEISVLDAEEKLLFQLINQYRQQHNLKSLHLSSPLTRAAKWMSADMAKHNYLEHQDSQKRNMGERLSDFGYSWLRYATAISENIARGHNSAERTLKQWKGSPPHNANILNPRFRVIGIGRGGGDDWFWTTDFGGR